MKENMLSTVEQAIERQAKARDTILAIKKTVLYQFGNCHGDVNEREKRLKESVKLIEDVLNNSSSQDVFILSMMLDRLLMNGLALQYDEIRSELEDLKSIWIDEKPEGLSKERLEALVIYIGRRIESICDKIVYKASTEETILKIARKALQQIANIYIETAGNEKEHTKMSLKYLEACKHPQAYYELLAENY